MYAYIITCHFAKLIHSNNSFLFCGPYTAVIREQEPGNVRNRVPASESKVYAPVIGVISQLCADNSEVLKHKICINIPCKLSDCMNKCYYYLTIPKGVMEQND